MNHSYIKTIKAIFLSLIFLSAVSVFAGCSDDTPKAENKDTNKTTTNCLPGQVPGRDC